MKKLPLVSVIIVNHNGVKWLADCLDSLIKQTYSNLEIIFVDNASTDGSLEFVRKHYKNVKTKKLDTNVGFASGNNEGEKIAKGEYLLLLNNDTKVGKNFVQNFIKAFDEIPNLCIAQSKIVHMDEKNKIDTCGSYLTHTSFLYHYGNGKNAKLKKYNKTFPVFSVKAASILIKREVIKEIGFFDDDFWSYYEETDMCHRGWLAGYESWYWPEAVCLHAGGGTSLVHFHYSQIQFHNFKNKLLSFFKNFSIMSLIYFVPLFLVLNIALSIAWMMQGKYKHAMSLYRAIYWNIKNWKSTYRKRVKIQSKRAVSDNTIFSTLLINPSIDYYKYLFNDDIKHYKDQK